MKCQTYRHLVIALTLFILSTYSATVRGLDYGLPREISVKIGNTEVKGYAGEIQNPDELPPEGFVYKVEKGSEPKIQIAVWSVSKREQLILRAAEAKLTEMIYEQQMAGGESPAGFLFSGKEENRYGNDPVQIAEPKPKTIKKTPALPAEHLAPVLANVAQQSPLSTIVGPTYQWHNSKYTYWFLLTLLVLLGVAWGAKRSS